MIKCQQPQAHPDRCGCEPDRYTDPGYCRALEQERDFLLLQCNEFRGERDALAAELQALKAQMAGQEPFTYVTLLEGRIQRQGSKSHCEEWAEAWNATQSSVREVGRATVVPLYAAPPAAQDVSGLEPVHGDVLPAVGSQVFIHLATPGVWAEHTVVGYYAWPDLDGKESLHRIFVRVRDSAGYLNARLLKDVRTPEVHRQAQQQEGE